MNDIPCGLVELENSKQLGKFTGTLIMGLSCYWLKKQQLINVNSLNEKKTFEIHKKILNSDLSKWL